MKCLLWAGLFCALLGAEQPVKFNLRSTADVVRTSSEASQYRATVLLFLAIDCPISNRYSPQLHQLETKYASRKVRFFAVFSGPGVEGQAIRRHLNDYGIEMEGLLDTNASLARQTGARVTPEAVILDAGNAMKYRGRIDNRFVAWGQTRSEATQNDLQDALDAVLSGQPAPHASTKALGCSIEGL